MEEILNHIQESFKGKVSVQQRRPGIYQLYLPLYHKDGDMVDIYIACKEDGSYTLCDYGLTLQRLSCSLEADNREATLQTIIKENKLIDDGGNLYLPTKPETVFGDIMHVVQAYAKIGSINDFEQSDYTPRDTPYQGAPPRGVTKRDTPYVPDPCRIERNHINRINNKIDG